MKIGPNKLECLSLTSFFQPSLMFAGNDRAFPIEAPFRCSTLGQAPGLAHKHQTMLERLATDKHSSLLRIFVNYGRKFFITLAPGLGQQQIVLKESERISSNPHDIQLVYFQMHLYIHMCVCVCVCVCVCARIIYMQYTIICINYK